MASTRAFGKLPTKATSNVKEYTLHIPEADLKHMQDLLKLTPVSNPVYENSLPNGGRRLGLRRDWLLEAKRIWETEFNWRATEDHINSFPNFRVSIEDEFGTFNIHFAALFSTKPDAVPLLLLHGWPGSFLEFIPTLQILRQKYTPETLPYHIVVPSLPGYTLSSSTPVDHDFTQVDAARIMDKVMKQIGLGDAYIAQGGDVGSRVARVLGVDHQGCKAVHLNFCSMSQPASVKESDLSQIARDGLKRWDEWKVYGIAYALEHATKPSTIGFVLNSNPLAVLSWIGEKYLDWTDNPPTLNTILEAVSLYWLTKSGHSSLWSYRHSFGPHQLPHDDPRYRLEVPFGYTSFENEIIAIPIEWAATTGNMVWSNSQARGGHFGALEQPKEFTEDIESFVAKVKDQVLK